MKLVLLFICLLMPLHGVYLLHFDDEEVVDADIKSELYARIMKDDGENIVEACKSFLPSVTLEWITPTAWQVVALCEMYNDEAIKEEALALGPIEYEERVHSLIETGDISSAFQPRHEYAPLFFLLNKKISERYKVALGCQITMVKSCSFEGAQPLYPYAYLTNPHSYELFFSALKDTELLFQLIEQETLAHRFGQRVFYRGYEGSGMPTTRGNHALSFGSTLLGGALFSVEACALTYSKPWNDALSWRFLAVRVGQEDIKELFRIGPLHPFLQLLSDGEIFHAHTKVLFAPYTGYFMKINKNIKEPLDYFFALDTTAEDLESRLKSVLYTNYQP